MPLVCWTSALDCLYFANKCLYWQAQCGDTLRYLGRLSWCVPGLAISDSIEVDWTWMCMHALWAKDFCWNVCMHACQFPPKRVWHNQSIRWWCRELYMLSALKGYERTNAWGEGVLGQWLWEGIGPITQLQGTSVCSGTGSARNVQPRGNTF